MTTNQKQIAKFAAVFVFAYIAGLAGSVAVPIALAMILVGYFAASQIAELFGFEPKPVAPQVTTVTPPPLPVESQQTLIVPAAQPSALAELLASGLELAAVSFKKPAKARSAKACVVH
jgi:hypothetical protein